MRFLADHDVYAVTSAFLRGLGHDVVLAAELGMAQAEGRRAASPGARSVADLRHADRDFGVLVFVQGRGPGVIYLRVIAATLRAVHDELARALSLYTEQELRAAFIVIEPGRHRIRRPRSST